jgi:3-dehydroquinate synthase
MGERPSVKIAHSSGSYEVLFASFSEAVDALPGDAFVVTDRNVAKLWRVDGLASHAVVPGEISKSVDTWKDILEWLADSGACRRSTVVALGGGVVGDLAGFVASAYMRGIPAIQIPTSLLAMVDSSVGGKVGIDLPQGKNLVGAFHPPTAVWICLETLSTLPQREFINGVSEVVKYGFILDPALQERLAKERLASGSVDLEQIVRRCVELKAEIVSQDEFETTGQRAILNFGHTVGHALERVTGYGPLLHGEAVAVGMLVEARLGQSLGITSADTVSEVERTLRTQGLPISHPSLHETGEMLKAMAVDKKATKGRLAFSLLTGVGQCKLVQDVPSESVEAVLRAC